MLCKITAVYENIDAAEAAVRTLRKHSLGIEKAVLSQRRKEDSPNIFAALVPTATASGMPWAVPFGIAPSMELSGENALLTGHPQVENNAAPQPIPFLGTRWAEGDEFLPAEMHRKDVRLQVLCSQERKMPVQSILRNSGALSVEESSL